jgi:hypothetical protein
MLKEMLKVNMKNIFIGCFKFKRVIYENYDLKRFIFKKILFNFIILIFMSYYLISLL